MSCDVISNFILAALWVVFTDVRLHDLRHAFATLHMKNGTTARVVSDLLGHVTVSFTLQTYSHPDAQMAAEAMETIEVALGATLNR